MKKMTTAAFAALFSCVAVSAQAHATLEQGEAAAGSYYKAVMRIPHGCEGQATHTVSIEVPEGLIGVKPMPKPGWDLQTRTGPYLNTYTNHGREVSEGVVEVTWSGGALPDDWYDEFIFRGKLADVLEPGATLYFRTTQTCEDGSVAWTEIPAEGQTRGDLRHPAPGLSITQGHAHSH